MYEGHFKLDRRPFAATPDPGCCYLSPTHGPLVKSVAQCIEHGQGIAILTGPAGIGKTLLGQVLLAESDRFTGVYLGTGQFPTRRALLQAILYELGQPYGGMTDQELRLELNTALRSLINRQDGMLLILDEAHLLSDRLLEEVRLVADLAQHGIPLARVVLSGNPEFEERLTSPALAAFNQRVACQASLETLTRAESIAYLDFRVRWAGGATDRLFERDALQLIANASDGVPRCLNQLADHSLTQTFLANHEIVSAAIVREALASLQHLPLRWNASAILERPTYSTTATVVSTVVRDETDAVTETAQETIESGETSCFEFGAGDTGPAVDVPEPSFETAPVSFTTVFETSDASGQGVQSDDVASTDDDGPPLFAWLAKPAKQDVETVVDEYAASSITIRAGKRDRTIAIEHEIVNVAPLTGPDFFRDHPQRQIELPRYAGVADAELPAEETVFDRYAVLDAPYCPVFPRPSIELPQVVIPSNVAVEPEDETVLEIAAIHQAYDAALASEPSMTSEFDVTGPMSPLERIDRIGELIEQADYVPLNVSGVELVTDFGVERIDVDLPTGTELFNLKVARPETCILEDRIGSTIVDVGRDLQQSMARAVPELIHHPRAAKIDELLEKIEAETRFDVVEPDAGPTATIPRIDPGVVPEASNPNSNVVPPPSHSYKNFFSTLRRRKLGR